MRADVFIPPGPVAQAFFECDDELAVLMGPVGSAKTTTGLMRGVLRSFLQKPGPDGRRRAKGAVIRRLYKDLEKTTMRSWNEWYPRTMGTWRGGTGDPATHQLLLAHPGDGGPVEITVEFIALGDLRIEEAMRGWEGTWAYGDECDLLSDGALPYLITRVGRFPSKQELGWSGVWGTCNAPEFDNHIVRDFIDDPKPGFRLFRQPGGRSPGAENLANLPEGYYERQVKLLKKHEVQRFVDNKPGISRDGDPVYDEFNDEQHMAAAPLAVLPSTLIVGLDAGGTPAAGFWQRAPNGQWRKLRELSTHENADGLVGPNRFGEAIASILAEDFRGLRVRAIADPSAAWGADTANGESSWIDTVARVAGITVTPAPTNDPTPRQEAYRLPMTRLIDGRQPGLLIDPSCKLTRRALATHYRYTRIGGPTGRRSDRPLKNWASHLIDADQYALLDGGAYHEVLARQQKRVQAAKAFQATGSINVFA